MISGKTNIQTFVCPVCFTEVKVRDESAFNAHLDACLRSGTDTVDPTACLSSGTSTVDPPTSSEPEKTGSPLEIERSEIIRPSVSATELGSNGPRVLRCEDGNLPDFDEEEEKAAAATVKSNQKGVLRDNAQDSRNSGGSSDDGLTLLYSSDEPTTTSVTTANSASARQLLRLTASVRYAI